jgi:hypothetical protein
MIAISRYPFMTHLSDLSGQTRKMSQRMTQMKMLYAFCPFEPKLRPNFRSIWVQMDVFICQLVRSHASQTNPMVSIASLPNLCSKKNPHAVSCVRFGTSKAYSWCHQLEPQDVLGVEVPAATVACFSTAIVACSSASSLQWRTCSSLLTVPTPSPLRMRVGAAIVHG